MSVPEHDILIVVRQGVYDQGVVGVTSDLDEAKEMAEVAAAKETDWYHDFSIRAEGESGEYDHELLRFASEIHQQRLDGQPTKRVQLGRTWEEKA